MDMGVSISTPLYASICMSCKHLLLLSREPNARSFIFIFYIFFIFEMARKMISLTERTYKELAQLGNLEDSFDSVIHRMIEREKVATSDLSLAGRSQIEQPHH